MKPTERLPLSLKINVNLLTEREKTRKMALNVSNRNGPLIPFLSNSGQGELSAGRSVRDQGPTPHLRVTSNYHSSLPFVVALCLSQRKGRGRKKVRDELPWHQAHKAHSFTPSHSYVHQTNHYLSRASVCGALCCTQEMQRWTKIHPCSQRIPT